MKRWGRREHLVGMGGLAQGAAIGRTDAELAAAGDEVAFARIVGTHHADMTRLAYVITGEVALAEDAVQSAWIRAWRNLRSIRDPERIRPWLLTIAANEARQVARRRRRTQVVAIDPETRSSPRSDPANAIARLDLIRALDTLSPDDRSLLAMRYVLGLDAGELGALTGRTASGVRARLSRLTARLRKELDGG
jgi:RNA polymerase sigma-70 factor (ECF subfamily)